MSKAPKKYLEIKQDTPGPGVILFKYLRLMKTCQSKRKVST